MFFKDHLRLVTDAGLSFDLGWDHDAPYNIDPLNGVDVDIQTAQGINQTGTTVERQNVSGVSRTLSVVFWGTAALDNARTFARSLPYYTQGTLYFGDAYFTRFVVQKTPYFSRYTPEPRCELMLYSPKPFWYSLTAQETLYGGLSPAFSFPVCYDSHQYSVKKGGAVMLLHNTGSLAVPFTATLHSGGTVVNPKVVDLQTGAFLRFDLTMEQDDQLEIYRTTSDRLACTLTHEGKLSNIFSALDEDSTLTELQPGDNVLALQADKGEDDLQAHIRFYPMEAGILPEPL